MGSVDVARSRLLKMRVADKANRVKPIGCPDITVSRREKKELKRQHRNEVFIKEVEETIGEYNKVIGEDEKPVVTLSDYRFAREKYHVSVEYNPLFDYCFYVLGFDEIQYKHLVELDAVITALSGLAVHLTYNDNEKIQLPELLIGRHTLSDRVYFLGQAIDGISPTNMLVSEYYRDRLMTCVSKPVTALFVATTMYRMIPAEHSDFFSMYFVDKWVQSSYHVPLFYLASIYECKGDINNIIPKIETDVDYLQNYHELIVQKVGSVSFDSSFVRRVLSVES